MQAAYVFWICGCAYLSCIGWLLSALHALNATGYAVALLPGVAAALLWLKKFRPPFLPQKALRRFRRPLPAIFLFSAALIFLGGVLYAPNNYDALTYRLPRMLNWLAAGTWHWISNVDARMNNAGPGWEWTAMPLLVLTRSDRTLFLLNALGFLWLPGLLFSVFRQLSVARHVAWTWMWILPLGYGYAVQAGSIGNDLFAAVLCLLSIHFGLRARRSGRVTDLWLAGLAAALMTGVKLSNLPLALPCLVALWPALPQLRKNWLGSFCVAVLVVVVSALPGMALNQLHSGVWTGVPRDQDEMMAKSPAAALLGNSLLLAEQSFMPPALPGSRAINDSIDRHLPDAWHQLLKEKYPRAFMARLNELPGEESAGLGLGVTLLLLGGVFAAVIEIGRRGCGKGVAELIPPVAFAAWIATAVYLVKMGSEAAPRLLLPYYSLALIPFLLLAGQARSRNHRHWQFFATLSALSVLPALLLSVSRPLWPGRSISARLAQAHPGNHMLQRMATTYDTYARRNDLLAPIRAHLPPDVEDIYLITGSNDTDYSLWYPVGQRRVHYLRRAPHAAGIEWLVVKENEWPELSDISLAEWAPANHFRLLLSTNIVAFVSRGGENWFLLHHEK